MTARILAALTAAALAGCTPPPEAPDDLSDLSRYLIREYDNEDPRALQVGIESLEPHLAGLDLTGPRGDRAFLPDDLVDDDLAAITHPDAPLAGCVPVAVAGQSRHEVLWFGELAQIVDQTPGEPSAETYARNFLAPDDPTCFADASCAHMETVNDVRRSNAIYTVEYSMFKDFRWVDVVAEGEPTGRRALLTRSWITEPAVGVNNQNTIVHSYTLDVMIGEDDGTTSRYQVLWSEADLVLDVEDDITAGTLRIAIDQYFVAQDNAIEDAFAPGG